MIYPFRFSLKLVDTCRIPQKRCVIGERFVPSSTSHGPCCGQPPGGSPFGGSETARGGALSQLSRDCWHSQYPLVISLGLQERLSPQDSQPSVFACCKAGQFSNQSTHEFDQQPGKTRSHANSWLCALFKHVELISGSFRSRGSGSHSVTPVKRGVYDEFILILYYILWLIIHWQYIYTYMYI